MIGSEEEARDFVAERCGTKALAQLSELLGELAEENARQNLVARATLESGWQRHIADSAQLLDHVPRETSGPWIDLGSGAGFPGLVIAVMRPDLTVRLVEPRKRRIEWLARMKAQFSLENCRIDGSRLELVESFPASVISARAFAPLPKLLSLSARFSTKHSKWVLPKGRSAAQEVAELPRKWRKMFHVEQSHTDPEAGIIVGTGRVES